MALKDLLTKTLPNYCFTLLSEKQVCFRPMLVLEEKSLLLAKETQDKQTILKNMINVISNCCDNDEIKNIQQVNIADFENLFLLIRSKSIGETETFSIKCPETQENIIIKINLEKDLKLIKNTANNSIRLNSNLAIIIQEPTVYSLFKYPNYETDNKHLFGYISSCIKQIQTDQESIDCNNIPEQEIIEFVENLTKNQFDLVVDYLTKISKTYIVKEYTTSDNVNRKIKISGLFNYFNFFLNI